MPRFLSRFSLPVVLLLLFASPCMSAQDVPPKQSGSKAAPVTATRAERGALPVQVTAIGQVEASATVDVKARINGLVTRVHFTEGQEVRQGDPLFSIDARDLEADLRTARANLQRYQAQRDKARKDKVRYDRLLAADIVSRDQQETTSTSLAALQAEIRAAEAAVDAAKVQLTYAKIRSPISGRTGIIQTDAGNMIKANADTPMVVISCVDPVKIRFAVPESWLGRIMAGQAAAPLQVTAAPSGSTARSTGQVSFIDSAVDASTGTITLKASFPNPQHQLWPGQFADVTLTVGQQENVVIVPEQAVTPGSEGEFVYVIRPDNTAEYRVVTTGLHHDGKVVIESGLDGGEQIVLDGQLRLSPGAAVIVRTGKDKPAGTSEPATGGQQGGSRS